MAAFKNATPFHPRYVLHAASVTIRCCQRGIALLRLCDPGSKVVGPDRKIGKIFINKSRRRTLEGITWQQIDYVSLHILSGLFPAVAEAIYRVYSPRLE